MRQEEVRKPTDLMNSVITSGLQKISFRTPCKVSVSPAIRWTAQEDCTLHRQDAMMPEQDDSQVRIKYEDLLMYHLL